MVKVSFPFHVLHGGRLRAPHEALEVTEYEARELTNMGAKVVGTSPKALEKASQSKPQPPASGKRPCVKRKG